MYHLYSEIDKEVLFSILKLVRDIPGQRYWFDRGVVKGGKRNLSSIGRPPERGS